MPTPRELDYDAKNPFYDDPMTLRDVRERTTFVTVDLKDGTVTFTTLTSSWTLTTKRIWPREELDTRLIAEGFESPRDSLRPRYLRDTILLEDKGIHPDENGEWPRRIFSVVATPERIRVLDWWLRSHGGDGVAHSLALSALPTATYHSAPRYHLEGLSRVIEPYLEEIPWAKKIDL